MHKRDILLSDGFPKVTRKKIIKNLTRRQRRGHSFVVVSNTPRKDVQRMSPSHFKCEFLCEIFENLKSQVYLLLFGWTRLLSIEGWLFQNVLSIRDYVSSGAFIVQWHFSV